VNQEAWRKLAGEQLCRVRSEPLPKYASSDLFASVERRDKRVRARVDSQRFLRLDLYLDLAKVSEFAREPSRFGLGSVDPDEALKLRIIRQIARQVSSCCCNAEILATAPDWRSAGSVVI